MKRILFLHDTLGMGGAEQLRFTLLKNIDRANYDVRICCISNRGVIGEAIKGLGFTVDELGLDPNPKNIFTTLKIIKYLKSQKIDVLHTSLFNANFHGRIAGSMCNIPRLISEMHGQHYEFKNVKYLFHLLSERLLYLMNDVIICCSENSRQYIIKREAIPPSKIVTITNCIDPSAYRVKEPRDSLRQKLGISDELALITVASFWKMKGHIYLLRALSELKGLGYKFKWLCAGDGPLREPMQKICAKFKLTKDVIFLGRVSHIADYLNASDLFVLPSLSEALSIALIEAMYAGLFCIVTDVGSNRELIENNLNGLIVKPASKEALRKALIFCFDNRQRLGRPVQDSKIRIEKKYLLTDDYLRKFYEIWQS
ncbi:MAG: glycosyltransferase family 4 protein [Candidatus Omnitrophica bacterium]|nr:glycosyltransferase family 4 protein [Candidatus Omnitrophota bacterium]